MRKRSCCSSSVIENQYLTRRMPERTEHALELGDVAEELLDLALGGEAHHPLDAGAVVPRAVEEHDLAAGGQVGDVALEVPLGLLALGRGGERDGADDAGVEALGDALDDAALAGAVAALEDDDDLLAVVDDPVLEADELGLEAQELAEVDPPVELVGMALAVDAGDLAREHRVVDLDLGLLVEAVEQLGLEPVHRLVVVRLVHRPSSLEPFDAF